MKGLPALALVAFLAAAGLFVARGLPAYAQARQAAARLDARVEALLQARRDVPLVSHAELDDMTARRDELAETVGQRISAFVEGPSLPGPGSLAAVLDRSQLPELAPGTPLRTDIEGWVEGRPRVEAAMTRLFDNLLLAGVEQVEQLTPAGTGEPVPLVSVPGLQRMDWELVVVSELPELLDLMESLVPGRDQPLLAIEGASLRRIDASLWAAAPPRLTSPPVRLWLRLAAVFGAPATSGDG